MRWFALCGLLWFAVLFQNIPTVSASETRHYSKILPIRVVQKVIHGGYTAIDENFTPCVDGVCPVAPITPRSIETQPIKNTCTTCNSSNGVYNTSSWGRPALFSRLRQFFGNIGFRFRR